MRKFKSLTSLLVLICAVTCYAQNISIPDPIFKARLLNHNPIIDTNADGEIQINEALEITSSLYLSGDNSNEDNIEDLTGLEAFVNVSTINASNNEITSIDLTPHIALENIRLNNNTLTEIDLSSNILLRLISMYNNNLSTLGLTNNPDLVSVLVSNMALGTLDTSQNPLLRNLVAENCNLSSVELSNNTNLEIIILHNNPIQELDLSNTVLVEELGLIATPLTSLALGTLPALKKLNLIGSELAHIDVSENNALEEVDLRNSLVLEEINFKNGTNYILDITSAFPSNFTNLPELNRVCIDDVTSALASFILNDVGHPVTFSEDCSLLEVNENEVATVIIHPNPTKNSITIETQHSITYIQLFTSYGVIIKPSLLNNNELDMGALPEGIYLLQINFNNARHLTKKIVKY
tara:strand:+ start:317 stop:1543 length:1227 start_codon:yes stop_codon:yes gene_type:complete